MIGPALSAKLAVSSADDHHEVMVFGRSVPTAEVVAYLAVSDEPPPSREELVDRIRERSRAHLAPLVSFLSGGPGEGVTALTDAPEPARGRVHDQFWVNNAIFATMSADSIRALETRPDVAWIELVKRASDAELVDGLAVALSAEPPPGLTWSVEKMNAPALWERGIDGDGIVVAVIDTGVNYNHPDLAGQMWTAAGYEKHGWNFFDDDDDPMDGFGHGTASAGVIAGSGASGTRTGVAPKAKIMALRAGATESSFWDALEFAIEHGADVISMSMTWKFDKTPNYPGWRRACESVLAAAVLHANSSGNQGAQLSSYPIPWNIGAPGNCPAPYERDPAKKPPSPITCGSTDDQDRIALTSGRGPSAWNDAVFADWPYPAGMIKPDVCGPGENTLSLNFRYGEPGQGKYARFTGTSAATPCVAGALALLAHACKRSGQTVVPDRIQRALEESAVRIDGQDGGKQNGYGAGRIDVAAAYAYGVQQGWWS
jgi:subtilisin family serine protease